MALAGGVGEVLGRARGLVEDVDIEDVRGEDDGSGAGAAEGDKKGLRLQAEGRLFRTS